MMTRRLDDWQMKLAAFVLPLWLAVAPEFCAWAWRATYGTKLPELAVEVLPLSYLALVLSGLVAASGLKSSFSKRAQTCAQWYVFGCMMLALAVACLLFSMRP